jgi:hypothetical protein
MLVIGALKEKPGDKKEKLQYIEEYEMPRNSLNKQTTNKQ